MPTPCDCCQLHATAHRGTWQIHFALVDIDETIVQRLELLISYDKYFVVTIAYGENICVVGYCLAVIFSIQGIALTTNMLVLPIGEPQIVWDTVSLKELCPIW